MENKLTAVDFLKDKFIMIQWLLVRDEISRAKADEFLNEWSEQAKKMEKEQTLDFASKVLNTAECSWSGIVHINEPLEDIYNETYNN